MGNNASKKKTSGKDTHNKNLPFFPPVLGIGRKGSVSKSQGSRGKSSPALPPESRQSRQGSTSTDQTVRRKSSGVLPSRISFARKSSRGSAVARRVSSPRASRRDSGVITTAAAFGRQETTLKARQKHPYDQNTMRKPSVAKGKLWKDNSFPLTIDQDAKEKPVKISWKRPPEYAPKFRLFGDTVDRSTVKQGQVGDCFYLSTLSAMADEPKLIKQLIPRDAYETDSARYNGLFHCLFWWMGEWIDVYADDLLPFNEDTRKVYGGRSDDKTVVWVPLMEKALARLCGSYKAVQGDQAHAYTLMTGGIVTKIKIQKREASDIIPPSDEVFSQITFALESSSIVLTNISESEASNPYLAGLSVNHSYSIHDAIKVKHGPKIILLLRIRNPWGETNKVKPANENGEWRGRWSYRSTEWNEVRPDLRKRHNVDFEKGGEFWVCMEDFFRIFEHVYIADTIPNFEEKGFRKVDRLNNVFNILGDWHGETAAGSDWRDLFRNPQFILVIPNKGLGGDNRMPIVIQLILQHEHPVKDTLNKDHLHCRIDVFREEAEELRNRQLLMSLTAISVTEIYLASRENTRQHRLSPGRYLLVPNYLNENSKRRISQPFCIRVFTATPVKCRELLDDSIALTGKPCETFENEDGTLRNQSVRIVTVFGEWRGETAAGSESVNRMKNPRFLLNIPGSSNVKVVLQLRPRRDIDVALHVRLDVFQIDESTARDEHSWLVISQITNMMTFMAGGEVTYDYILPPGKYFLLPNYSAKGQIDSAFCIRILSSSKVECRPQPDHPVMFIRTTGPVLKDGNKSYDLGAVNCFFGAWVKYDTAGGQIRYDTFNTNPQYQLTVNGKAPQPILIELLQECVAPIHAIGCFVVKATESHDAPLDNNELKHGARVNTVEGKPHTFIQSLQSSGYYMLPPGRYVILPFADQPSDEKRFSLVIASQGSAKSGSAESKRKLSTSANERLVSVKELTKHHRDSKR